MLWRKILAIIVGLMGAGYFAQGAGLFTVIPSFMNNDIRWAVIGVGLVIVALLIWPRSNQQEK